MAGTTFTVKIEGLSRLTKALSRAPEEIEPIMQNAINLSAAVLAENTDQKTVPFRRGDLIRSFKPVHIGRLFARWWPRADYARALQFGREPEPGRYVPAIKKRLKPGTNKDGSQRNIGMWPGFKGRHYMEKIRAASKSDIDEVFKNALRRAVATLAR